MIDRLVHYAEIISLKGDSCRLKDKELAPLPEARDRPPALLVSCQTARVNLQPALTRENFLPLLRARLNATKLVTGLKSPRRN